MSLALTHSASCARRAVGISTTLALLLCLTGKAHALASLRCETVEIVDHVGLRDQMQIPKLVEAMKAIALTIVPERTAADIRIEINFNSASGRINVAIRGWAESESVDLESDLVSWSEDFKARRRDIKPMKDADAAAFRQTIVKALTDFTAARAFGVALASEPPQLAVTVTSPPGAVAPINRNRTAAILGCVKDGTELRGFLTFSDGREETFDRRASAAPGLFVVGSTPRSDGADAHATAPQAPRPDESTTIEHSAPAAAPSAWRWPLGALLGLVVVALGFRTWRRSRVTR